MRNVWMIAALVGAACSTEITGPSPSVEGLTPALVCRDQLVTEVHIAGALLSPLAIDTATGDPKLALPDVTLRRTRTLAGAAVEGEPILLANDPAAPEAAIVRWTSSAAMSFEVSPALALMPGLYEITVTNRNGRSVTVEAALTAVPMPTVTSVEPDLVCLDQDARSVTLTGTGFLKVGALLPTVDFDGVSLPVDALADCTALPGPTAGESCLTATVTLPQAALEPGAPALVLTNPSPAACHSEDEVTIAVVPGPTLTAVEPDLFCSADGDQTLTLTGSDFLTIDGVLPTVTVGTETLTAATASDCAPVAGTLRTTETCTVLTVVVPQGALAAGVQVVSVTNADPAGCTSDAVTTAVVGPPSITSITPAGVCSISQPDSMTVTGESFLSVDGVLPSVTVDGTPVDVTAVDGCMTIAGTSLVAEECTSLTFAVPTGGFALGAHDVQITNPPPADCSTAAAGTFDVTEVPTLVDVVPARVCSDGGTFDATGGPFGSGSRITLDGGTAVPTTFVDATRVRGTIAPFSVAAGTHDVTVSNGPGCEATLANALTIVDQPVVFFVDPPVVYNGINLQVTVYASGISGAVSAVGVRPTGTMDPLLPLAFTHDLARPNRILATVPQGTAAGDWDVVIVDEVCSATLQGGLHVTDTLTVDVATIDPTFGWTAERTAVTIGSPTPAGTGLENFHATPRAYLNPAGGGAVLATELRAVAYLDDNRLTGVVPDGLAVGSYDVIVVNPDGHVGVLAGAYQVSPERPPEVTSLTPGSVANQAGQAVTVTGADFRAAATVSARCRTSAGVTSTIAGTVGTVGATSITSTWDLSALTGTEVCVLRVTNTDGTYGEYSALSVTLPSANLNAFQAATSMVTARRAAGAVALRLNAVSRFVFAIGGDDGLAPATAHASVEAAPVDAFGSMGAWATQVHGLPAGRSFTAAVGVERFVYLAGGTVAGVPDASVLRAYLLDPFEAPEISDLDLARGGGVGLGGGTWYYRVAAVMDAADPTNPGGEALASEPLIMNLPDLPERIQVTLRFTVVPGAAAYRIYRTPTADLIAGQEQLLAEIPAPVGAPSFTDAGLTVPALAPSPLALGSLGVWHVAGTLAVAREGAAVVAVPDPNVAGTTYLYVLGGRNAAGVAVATHEWATISAPVSNRQTVGAFATGAATLPTGRWQAGAVYTDATKATAVPATDAYVYVLPGVSGAGVGVEHVNAFQVDTVDGVGADDGSLGAAIVLPSPNVGGGYGYAAGNDFIYQLGASGGAPSASARSAKICEVGEAGCAGGAPEPPDLKNWNAGITLATARYLHATATESGFIFLLGGQTIAAPASTSTERTNF